jgi:hypothetical protein
MTGPLEREAREALAERRRPMAHPVHDPWTAHVRDAAEALAGVLVLFVLMFVLPALLWLVLS